MRGLPELFVFLVIVLALFLRGASLPAAASWSSSGCRPCPARSGCSGRAAIAAVVGVAC